MDLFITFVMYGVFFAICFSYIAILYSFVGMTLDYGYIPHKNIFEFISFIFVSCFFLLISFGMDSLLNYLTEINLGYFTFFNMSFLPILLSGILLFTRKLYFFLEGRKNNKKMSSEDTKDMAQINKDLNVYDFDFNKKIETLKPNECFLYLLKENDTFIMKNYKGVLFSLKRFDMGSKYIIAERITSKKILNFLSSMIPEKILNFFFSIEIHHSYHFPSFIVVESNVAEERVNAFKAMSSVFFELGEEKEKHE